MEEINKSTIMAHETAGFTASFKSPIGPLSPQKTKLQTQAAQTPKSSILPLGTGPYFSYSPSTKNKQSTGLSPNSSSPEISLPSSPTSSTTDVKAKVLSSPSRRLSSSPDYITSTDPCSLPRHGIPGECAFTLEELDTEEYNEQDLDTVSVIWPHQYEEVESDLDGKIAGEFRNLTTESFDDHEAFVEVMRAERRRRRRSSVQKRTLSMSIGSDTDDEDLQPIVFDANEAGSSARRLRRRVGERASLIFDDPPERIEEVDEGSDGVERIVEMVGGNWSSSEDEGMLQRELPYWSWEQVMDVDSDSDDY